MTNPQQTRRRKQPHTFDFTASGAPRTYLLSGVDVPFWRRVQRKCKAERSSVRATILRLLSTWLES